MSIITLLKKPQTEPPITVVSQALKFENFVSRIESDFKQSLQPVLNTETSSSLSLRNILVIENTTNPIQDIYCEAPSFIDGQIPFWMKQNYGASDSNNYFTLFLKEYYNWIYCGFKKEEIQLTPYDIEELLDIERVPDAFLNNYVKTYAPFINLSDITPTDRQYVRSFLKSLKSNFLITKGTEDSYRYILKTLFNITNVQFQYPKKYLMRLNGGKYIDFQWDVTNNTIIDLPQDFDVRNPTATQSPLGGYDASIRPNLFGAALNEAVLPDDYFWQEHSYLLTSSADVQEAETYKSTVLAGAHPAGMLGFFEQYIPLEEEDAGPDEVNDEDTDPISTGSTEQPVISHYLLFSPNRTENNLGTIGSVSPVCFPTNGYFCYCCTNDCDPTGVTGYYPQHWWPKWADNVRIDLNGSNVPIDESLSNISFARVKIGSFIDLFSNTYPSPNAGTGSTCEESIAENTNGQDCAFCSTTGV